MLKSISQLENINKCQAKICVAKVIGVTSTDSFHSLKQMPEVIAEWLKLAGNVVLFTAIFLHYVLQCSFV